MCACSSNGRCSGAAVLMLVVMGLVRPAAASSAASSFVVIAAAAAAMAISSFLTAICSSHSSSSTGSRSGEVRLFRPLAERKVEDPRVGDWGKSQRVALGLLMMR